MRIVKEITARHADQFLFESGDLLRIEMPHAWLDYYIVINSEWTSQGICVKCLDLETLTLWLFRIDPAFQDAIKTTVFRNDEELKLLFLGLTCIYNV